jgi:uncharacterized protein YbjT (DUF2867 family)
MVRKPLAETDKIVDVDYCIADFNDPASLKAALTGVTRAFLVTNSSEQVEAQQLAFIQAAKESDVKHIVYLSQLHAAPDSPLRFLRYHANIEAAIASAGIAVTSLRPNLYMQGILQIAAPTIAKEGRFYAPMEDAKVSLVDVRDIASVAAIALTDEGHENQSYDLTGSELLSFSEIAARLSEALRRPIEYVNVPEQAMREALARFHMPEWQAEGLLEDFAHYRRHEAEDLSPAIEEITGQTPRTFSQFASDHKSQFLSES